MDETTPGGLETVAAEKSEIQAQEKQDQDPAIQPLASNDASEEASRGVKRAAEDEAGDEQEADESQDVQITTEGDAADKPLSKNQQRKLKRQKMWEEKKQDRASKRKEKRHTQQERRRAEREEEIAKAKEEGRAPVLQRKERTRDPKKKTQVPVSIIIDCQFEEYMFEKEQISLSSQVTRSYSDNRTAQYPVHLSVSSWGGKLENRFDTTLKAQYKQWKGIDFVKEDFVGAGKLAAKVMAGEEGGTVIDVLKQAESGDSLFLGEMAPTGRAKKHDPTPQPEPEAEDVDKSIVYLTADSPYVLDRLEPNTSYVIGGIIDRNRHKGLCYKVARERNVRTAKLPIGEFMVLHDRHVLATNHVVEIMLRWLELGDWGAAFMQVIPMRKGAKLKDDVDGSEAAEDEEQEEDQVDAAVEEAEAAEEATAVNEAATIEEATAAEAEVQAS
ncbi:tRNA (guanine(9)-N(1))-methyltransferase [Pestalotiopsis sp. 9143b]|nr:tRNA (guanine(9)-N(1))-methyltransferase [Pestalotiopsis sp. 9143b]